VRLGRRGNLFADLSRVVTEGSRGLGKRCQMCLSTVPFKWVISVSVSVSVLF